MKDHHEAISSTTPTTNKNNTNNNNEIITKKSNHSCTKKRHTERSEREKILDNYFSSNTDSTRSNNYHNDDDNDNNNNNTNNNETEVMLHSSIDSVTNIDYLNNNMVSGERMSSTSTSKSNKQQKDNSDMKKDRLTSSTTESTVASSTTERRKSNNMELSVEITPIEKKEEFINGPYTFLPYYKLATTTTTKSKSSKNKNSIKKSNNNDNIPMYNRNKYKNDRRLDRFGFIIDSDDNEDDDDDDDDEEGLQDCVTTSVKTEQCNNTTKSKRSLVVSANNNNNQKKSISKKNKSKKKSTRDNNNTPHSNEQQSRQRHGNNTTRSSKNNTSHSNNRNKNSNNNQTTKPKSTYLSKIRKLRMKNYVSQKNITTKHSIDTNNSSATIDGTSSLSTKQQQQKIYSLRYQKWTVMLSSWDRTTTLYKTKLIRRLRKGIPDEIRGPAWSLIGNVPFSIESQPGKYYELLSQSNAFYDNGAMSIERDIHRTFPRHAFFADNYVNIAGVSTDKDDDDSSIPDLLCEKGGQASLRRVLRAYSILDHEVFYCQGMNFIAAMFLTVMTEEEAFWLLVNIMNHPPCKMRHLFGENMLQAQQILHVSSRLIQHYLPKLHAHFERENVHVTMYATQWLLTIYTSSFKFELVTRVWDVFLYQGWKVVYRVMLSILDLGSKEMLSMNFETILGYMKKLPSLFTEDVVMKRAFSIKLRTKLILKYEKEWLEMQN